jgi:hypothetical protein
VCVNSITHACGSSTVVKAGEGAQGGAYQLQLRGSAAVHARARRCAPLHVPDHSAAAAHASAHGQVKVRGKSMVSQWGMADGRRDEEWLRSASTAGSGASRGTAAKARQLPSMLAGACRARTAHAGDRDGSAPEPGSVGWYTVRRGSGPSCAARPLRVCKPAVAGLGICAGECAALGTALSRLRRAALSCRSLLAVSFASCKSHARVPTRASHVTTASAF